MIKSFDYDLFVIGTGTEGVAAARQAAGYGARSAISQRNRVGGTCIIHGCISEKLIAYAASFSHFLKMLMNRAGVKLMSALTGRNS